MNRLWIILWIAVMLLVPQQEHCLARGSHSQKGASKSSKQVQASTLILRVAVQINVKRTIIGASNNAKVLDGHHKVLGHLKARKPFAISAKHSKLKLQKWRETTLWIDPGPQGFVYAGRHWYRGKLLIYARGKKLTIVNYVSLEQYLYSVVGSEMGRQWPLEALKAQAVAARTYALYKRKKAIDNKQPFDLGATAHWQAYKGVGRESPKTRRAVKETQGLVLVYQHAPILAVYHSSSGGHTESVEYIWNGKKLPYLKAVPDFDQGSKVYRWTKRMPPQKLQKILKKKGHEIGELKKIEILKTSPFGYVQKLRVVGKKGSIEFSGRAFKYMLDLRSTRFKIKYRVETKKIRGQKRYFIREVIFQGRGFGHGLGMSQFGAKRLAEKGYKYNQILGYYYQKVKLARLSVKSKK